MLFNSFEFLLFFPFVTIIYFLLPYKIRWFHLLAASCIFYMAFIPVYILILVLTVIIDYMAGIMIENAKGYRRKWFLVMSIVANVGVLAFFKYGNFFIININDLLNFSHVDTKMPILDFILPLGLSFHTFQAMSYTIEVYRGHQKAEHHFGIYSLYVMFYPQLVAGPIERPQNLLHQFYEKHYFDYENAVLGLRLMLWGFIKKIVIADRLTIVVDQVFNDSKHYSGIALFVGAVFFAFQIYCDFSGYSDIAIGSARIIGFKLMTNFNNPYHSRNVSEFWKRWHISLSTWFKDYLYISLGGNRVSVPRIYFNLFFVFLVSGFWHGANWTFLAWGALHGFYLIFGLFTKNFRNKIIAITGIGKIHWLNNILNVSSTFLLVTIAWVFFRAKNLTDALYIVNKFFNIPNEISLILKTKKIAFLNLPGINNILLPCFLLIILLELSQIIIVKYKIKENFYKTPILLRWSLYYLGVITIFYFGVFEKHQFIYFQF